jgi:hypothetical protein
MSWIYPQTQTKFFGSKQSTSPKTNMINSYMPSVQMDCLFETAIGVSIFFFTLFFFPAAICFSLQMKCDQKNLVYPFPL